MRKLDLRYLWTAAPPRRSRPPPSRSRRGPPVAAMSGQTQSQADSSRARCRPRPASRFRSEEQAPSAAEVKKSRARLDKYASCLKDNGFDVPAPGKPIVGQAPRPPRPPSSAEMKKMTSECGTPPAPPAILPPLDKKHIEEARKAMAKGNCPPPPAPPAPRAQQQADAERPPPPDAAQARGWRWSGRATAWPRCCFHRADSTSRPHLRRESATRCRIDGGRGDADGATRRSSATHWEISAPANDRG